MTTTSLGPPPVPTAMAATQAQTWDTGVTLLTIYIAILWWIPSSQSIGFLGSLGVPGLLWGFVCLGYWVWYRLQRLGEPFGWAQPVRIAFLFFFAAVWLTFGFAHASGLPGDEVSPSVTGLLRTLSWAGVILLANDAIRTREQLLALLRRIALMGGLLACLGLAQFLTGESFVDRIHIPGFAVNDELLGVMDRSGFTRANATATHPLEFAAVLVAVAPLSLSLAMIAKGADLHRTVWIPIAAGLACLLSSSRSAIVGFAVGVLVILPMLAWRTRLLVGAAISMGLVLVYLSVPGMLGSVTGLFINRDASTASRSNSVSVVLDIVGHHPVLGRGFGTFLPKYYILDNQLLLLLIEVGVVGLAAFLGLFVAALVQSQRSRRASADPKMALIAQSLTAALAACTVLFAFFDAFSFSMAAGTFAVLVGLSGAARNIVVSEDPSRPAHAGQAASIPPTTWPGSSDWRRVALPLGLVGAVGVAATAGVSAAVLHASPRYWSRTEMVVVHSDVTAKQAMVKQPDADLVPLAAAVERVANDGRVIARLNSDQATLAGTGVREGVSIHLRNDGNQWVPLFRGPVLVIETVANSPETALAVNLSGQQKIRDALLLIQSTSVDADRQAHTVAVPEDPTLGMTGASRKEQLMALVGAFVAGSLLTSAVLMQVLRRSHPSMPG